MTHDNSAAARAFSLRKPGPGDEKPQRVRRHVPTPLSRRSPGATSAAWPLRCTTTFICSRCCPAASREWHGRSGVNAAFTGWFDGFDEYELVDAEICEVGPRLHLSWRLRVRTTAISDRSLLVEQHVYADIDADGRISQLSLLCSGFWRERARA